jgi:hypothetical protein
MRSFYCAAKTRGETADKYKVSSISSISANSLQQILSLTLQNALPVPSTQAQDTNQLSPLAQVLHTLQQLQLTDPTKYKAITGQIATALQSSAQSAEQQGDTTLANRLSKIAKDFAKASQTGQLPDVQDLTPAIDGRHHHHRRAAAAAVGGDADSSGVSSTSSPTSSGTTSASGLPDALSVIVTALSTGGH